MTSTKISYGFEKIGTRLSRPWRQGRRKQREDYVLVLLRLFIRLVNKFCVSSLFLFRTFENDEKSVRYGMHYFKQLKK